MVTRKPLLSLVKAPTQALSVSYTDLPPCAWTPWEATWGASKDHPAVVHPQAMVHKAAVHQAIMAGHQVVPKDPPGAVLLLAAEHQVALVRLVV